MPGGWCAGKPRFFGTAGLLLPGLDDSLYERGLMPQPPGAPAAECPVSPLLFTRLSFVARNGGEVEVACTITGFLHSFDLPVTTFSVRWGRLCVMQLAVAGAG